MNKELETLKANGIYGTVKPITLPTVDGAGEVHFDDYNLMFQSRFGHTKVCLNGLEEIFYGKQSTYIIEEKKGWLVFIEDKS